MSEPPDRSIERERPSVIGCMIMLVTLVVIFGTAVPIVMWRDPETGRPLPRMVAVFTPLLIGAAFHASLDGILRLVGVLRRAATNPRTRSELHDDTSPPAEAERHQGSTDIFEKRD
jgi:hypothetical protein